MYQLLATRYLKNKVCLFFLSTVLIFSLASCEDTAGPDPDAPSVAEAMQADGELSVFAQLINEHELGIDLQAGGPFTVFAPADSVLEARNLDSLSNEELKSLLLYHIVPADLPPEEILDTEKSVQTLQKDSIFISNRTQQTKINNTALIKESQRASNGRIHKIDGLLFPDAAGNVYDITDKRYYTHKFACSCTSGRTGLINILTNTDNDYTVFAPSDKAFKQRAEEYGSVDDLSNEELKKILQYHVVEGKLLSSDLSEGEVLTTINGAEITVTSASADGTIVLNDGEATLQIKNLEGTNGVVHVIDQVMELPSQHN